jgi:hypothetical protein
MLHLSKVAVACASVEALRTRQRARMADGIVPIVTRFMPKRAEELIGGSIFWIVKHRIVARQTIEGFAPREEDNRITIKLDPELVTVQMRPRPAHQGWRYLADEDAPPDLWRADADVLALLPPQLASELVGLALI